MFKAIVGIASEAASAFIKHRKSGASEKTLYAMKQQQKFQVKRLEFLEEAMNLYDRYCANIIEEILNTINHLAKTLSKHEEIIGGKQLYWYK